MNLDALTRRPSTCRVRELYVRGLGLVHLIAFVSLWWQIQALVGSDGVAPFVWLWEAARQQFGDAAWWWFPSLLWWWPTDGAMHAMCALGALLGGSVLLGTPWRGPQLAVLAVLYLSLSTAGWVFLQFQWDTLLIEATVAAAFVAEWRYRAKEPPLWAWALQWWLVFRLMFFAGWVKLASGDPTWWGLTALDVHFWTQPLPNPLSRFAHHAPDLLHRAGVLFTFAVELVLPFAIVAGRHGRAAVFVGFTALMLGLAITGNYGFFQLLSIVLAFSLLDDRHLAGVGWPLRRSTPDASARGWADHLGVPLAVGLVGLSLLRLPDPSDLPMWGQTLLRTTSPFRIVNNYGLFARMTTDRPEVLFEGSDDGITWRELHLAYKPGRLDQVPRQVAPHMPRMDWQLWFAALGACRNHPWVVRLMQEVADANPRMHTFFASDAFVDGHPLYVRAVRYRYTFTAWGEEGVWARQRLGPYCDGVVTRQSAR